MKKIAVLFPGIGYTCEKPLLYYSAKLAAEAGFEVVRVPYGNFPPNVKGDASKMYRCFLSAREILSSFPKAWEQSLLSLMRLSMESACVRCFTLRWRRPFAFR